MIKISQVKVPVDYTPEQLPELAAGVLGVAAGDVLSVRILKKSLDARRKGNIHYVLSLGVTVSDQENILARHEANGQVRPEPDYVPREVPERTFDRPPVVVGSGPAGLFAALTLARAGARPLLLERGGSVEDRRRTVEGFWAGGDLDPECNVQFGEGGAGTFSDGKLTTGTRDPRIQDVLHTLRRHGAPEDILFDARPHIGTDLLADTVRGIREEIVRLGGRVEFWAKFTDYRTGGGRVTHALYQQDGQTLTVETGHIVLATGHSARDVFRLLRDRGEALEQKPFSVGVRIEHLQRAIDDAMYGGAPRRAPLPAADYKLAVHLPSGRGVYTFCMCPGGLVVAGASEHGGVVTNGMSYHARAGKNANSALLVGVGPGDFGSSDPLAGVGLQREIEERAFSLAGGYRAPAVRVGDFLHGTGPGAFGAVKPTYRPGTVPVPPERYLPAFVTGALGEGLALMGKKIRGFDAPDAVLTGPETRSSSPVRVLRGADGCSVSCPGLYPCGEGAGYAGGIMSAAVDGIRTAEHILGMD